MVKIATLDDLKKQLHIEEDLSNKAYDRSCGPKGRHGNSFYLGYHAAMESVITAIETGESVELDNDFHEARGYKVDENGKRVR